MGLTRAAIAQPFLTFFLTIALVVGGCLSWSRMPVDLNPQTDLPSLIVHAVYPGAGPAAVEELVAEPLETALRRVAGVLHVNSVSQDGFCFFFVELEDGTEVDAAIEDCRQAIEAERAELPDDLEQPTIAQLDLNAQPVVFLGLLGDRPLGELRRVADDRLRPLLEAVDGVARVEVLGGRTREVSVAVERARLAAAGLTLGDLLEPLRAASLSAPGGPLTAGDRELGTRLDGELRSLDDLRALPIPPPPGAPPTRPPPPEQPRRALTLGDLAEVSLHDAEPEVRIRLQQREAVGLIVTKRGRGNTVAVSRGVTAAIERAGLPPDIQVVTARDTAGTVREGLADVNASIVLGVLLCAGTILLFLRNVRGTLIVAVTIPVVLLGTFAPMGFGGHSINQMTLLGLALSVGILVDDSIVCLEAIMFRLRAGEPAAEAAFNGRNDIALADTSTTLIDLAVFVPIAVMSGVVGQFFRDFGFVVAVAAALSLLAAYTLVPALTALTYRRRPPVERPPARWYVWLEARYAHTLRWALSHRRTTLLAGWSALLIAGGLAWRSLGTDFIPAADLSTVLVNLELPAGSSLAATERAVIEAEPLCAQIDEAETLFVTLGRIETGFGIADRRGANLAQINLVLRDRRGLLDVLLLRGWDLRRRSDELVAEELRQSLRRLGGVAVQVIPVRGWAGAGAPIDCSLFGADLEQMSAVGEAFVARLAAIPGVVNADKGWRIGAPEVRVTPRRGLDAELMVYPGAIARELRLALTGWTGAAVRLDGQLIRLHLRLAEGDRRDLDDVAALPVGRTGRRMATIGDVAELREQTGPTRIDRRDGRRDLNFKAHLTAGATLGDAQRAIESAWRELGIRREGTAAIDGSAYPGLSWGWRGDAATLDESAGVMAATAAVGALLVYLIMAVLFGSPVHPLTIMLSVPMAVTGALLLLVLTGSSFSMVAGIGMILLIGIVVRNAILLIDHIRQGRGRGVARNQAVLEAGARRLRPILMTTLTTILGMLPVALKIGKGAEIRSPMAIAVIGGLALSTLLTLVIIPVTYTVFDDWAGGDDIKETG